MPIRSFQLDIVLEDMRIREAAGFQSALCGQVEKHILKSPLQPRRLVSVDKFKYLYLLLKNREKGE
jgi:hypothetical protein